MGKLIRVAACALVVAGWLSHPRTSRGEENVSGNPADLVRAALKSELEGPSELRASLLGQALARDPNFAPARWQSGFVRWDDEWLKVDDVPRRARDNEQLAAYRKLRNALVDTADNHRELATWCRKHKLPDEERIHWAKVLEFDQNDAEALKGLGLQLVDGRLLTRKQIEQENKRTGEQLRATKHWQPLFVKWRSALEHVGRREYTNALDGLRKLSDPDAIPALEAVFGASGTSQKSTELNRLLIETVGRMPQPEATQVLLRSAIVADSLEVRTLAADELKKRPMHAYVPQLIAACPESFSLRTQYQISFMANGGLVVEMSLLGQEGRSEYSIAGTIFVNAFDRFISVRRGIDRTTPNPARAARIAIESVAPLASLEAMAEAHREQRRILGSRVQFVLQRTTGFVQGTVRELLEKQWNEYNDSYQTASSDKPYRQVSESYSDSLVSMRVMQLSCFPAGTSVMALGGPVAIEQIKVGDRVLAQNPRTGELAYQAVQATTLRPATVLMKIGTGPDAIRTTRGHPFWVTGRGWRIAKSLKAGDQLHGVNGAVVIDNIEVMPPTEAYNLVVSNWHTYFVGDQRLLVHDNTRLQETAVLVPGLAPNAEPLEDSLQAAKAPVAKAAN